MINSISLSGGIPGKSSGKTFGYITTYITTSYISYIGRIDDLKGLEIVEVAYGGLATGRGVIGLRVM
jgi:hypothetical protein